MATILMGCEGSSGRYASDAGGDGAYRDGNGDDGEPRDGGDSRSDGGCATAAPGAADGCCPDGATCLVDPDCGSTCGDGLVCSDEECDDGVGSPLSCPTACDDGDPCTADQLSGDACQVVCQSTPVTSADSGLDGCCPAGVSCESGDTDCPSACDDGLYCPAWGEICDDSAGWTCPTACDDGDACTTESMQGGPATCDAVCVPGALVTTCTAADGCCPAGCGVAQGDTDCIACGNAFCDVALGENADNCGADCVCGDGVVDTSETCDDASPLPADVCPIACDDGSVCTADSLDGGGTCQAICTFAPIVACMAGDGCCPAGCDVAQGDTDCVACGNAVCDLALGESSASCGADCFCGDGVVDSDETCDAASPLPAEACPAACDDGNVCTADSLDAAGTCQAACTFAPILACTAGDGCCPAGCDIAQGDTDCPGCGNATCDLALGEDADSCGADCYCGDGVVDSTETCDDTSSSPTDACPTSCSDSSACTSDSLVGDPASCDVACLFDPIVVCSDADGCCPVTCDETTDANCIPSCGNGVIDAGETCDPPGSCPTSCDDSQACTTDTLIGDASLCTAGCLNQPVPWCDCPDSVFSLSEPPEMYIQFEVSDWWGDLDWTWPSNPWSCPWDNIGPGQAVYEADGGYSRVSVTAVHPTTGETCVVNNAGIRYRGHTADTEIKKLGLEIVYDAFVAGQRLFGLCKQELFGEDGGDSSRMRQCVSHGIFRKIGVVTPRCNFLPVWINGNRETTFQNLEMPDNRCFTNNRFGAASGGDFYRCDGDCDSECPMRYSGSSVNSYPEYWPIPATVEADRSDALIPMLECTTQASDASYRACTEALASPEALLRPTAAELSVGNRDSIAGDGDNGYFYDHPTLGFIIIPHDQDESWYPNDEAGHSVWRNARGELLDRARDVYFAEYCAVLKEMVASPSGVYSDPGFAAIWDPMFASMSNLMATDPQYSFSTWEQDALEWPGRVSDREDKLLAEVAFGCNDGDTFAYPPPSGLVDEELIAKESVWLYRDSGSEPAGAWETLGYDDSAWSSGQGPLGYGTIGMGSYELQLNTTTASRHTVYFRRVFTATNVAELSHVRLHLVRDDGAVIYLNGQEILRSNMQPGAVSYSTDAWWGADDREESGYMWSGYIDPALLVEGDNILTVEVHQLGSSDFVFDLSMHAKRL